MLPVPVPALEPDAVPVAAVTDAVAAAVVACSDASESPPNKWPARAMPASSASRTRRHRQTPLPAPTPPAESVAFLAPVDGTCFSTRLTSASASVLRSTCEKPVASSARSHAAMDTPAPSASALPTVPPSPLGAKYESASVSDKSDLEWRATSRRNKRRRRSRSSTYASCAASLAPASSSNFESSTRAAASLIVPSCATADCADATSDGDTASLADLTRAAAGADATSQSASATPSAAM